MLWLCLMVQHIDKEGEVDDTLNSMREYFAKIGTVHMGGCQHPNLGDYITSPDQRTWLLAVSTAAIKELQDQGNMLSAEWLNIVCGIEGGYLIEAPYSQSCDAKRYIEYADKWIALVKGNSEIMVEPSFGDIHIDYYYRGGEYKLENGYPRAKCSHCGRPKGECTLQGCPAPVD